MGLRNGPSDIKSADFSFHFGNHFGEHRTVVIRDSRIEREKIGENFKKFNFFYILCSNGMLDEAVLLLEAGVDFEKGPYLRKVLLYPMGIS